MSSPVEKLFSSLQAKKEVVMHVFFTAALCTAIVFIVNALR